MPAVALCLALLLAAQHSTHGQAIQDSRCYLMNGGAVESFFISEDTPVGSVIGTLSVNGDPDERGDITLRVQERGAAVGIAPGTKNVTLLRALDREGTQGPSNVYANVRCDRRGTTDPSFIIPVSVRVWDVNDNAPAWVGAPYRVRLSELTAVGTRVLAGAGAKATDADQPGPHATVRYSVVPGPNSEYFGFANELDSILVLKKPLDYETLKNFTIVLRAEDQGSPSLHNDTTLQVEVLDADDQNPRFLHDHYKALLPPNPKEGTVLETSPSAISAVDQDVGINAPVFYSSSGDNQRLVEIDRDTGRVSASKHLLDLDQPVTIVIKATQVDNSDRYALATLSISRVARSAAIRPAAAAEREEQGAKAGAGAGEAKGVKFVKTQFLASVSEGAPMGTVVTTLNTDPPPRATQNPLQFYVSDRSFLDKFAINNVGEVLVRKALDYETTDSYSYQVMVTDGRANDTASLNITVLNVNEWEPRFRYPQYEFRVGGDGGDGGDAGDGGAQGDLLPVGKLEVFDGDKSDKITLTLRGADAGALYLKESGEMLLRRSKLRSLNSTVLHAVATAVDSGSPPRQTSVPVIVHLDGRLVGAKAGVGVGEGAGAGVVALFAAALALLALLVCALLAYIYRVRRSKPNSAAKNGGFVSHEKVAPGAVGAALGVGGGVGVVGATGGGGSSGSLLSVSAGASTILANSTSSLDLRSDHNANLASQRQRTGESDPRGDQSRGGRAHQPHGLLLSGRTNSLPSRKYSAPTYGSLSRHTIKARHLKSIIYALPDSPEQAASRPTNGEPWVATTKGATPYTEAATLPIRDPPNKLKTINENTPSEPGNSSHNKGHYSVVQKPHNVANKEIVRATIESPSRANSVRINATPTHRTNVNISRENTSENLKQGIKSTNLAEPNISNSNSDVDTDQNAVSRSKLPTAADPNNVKQNKNLNNFALKAKLNQNNLETINKIREETNFEPGLNDTDSNKIDYTKPSTIDSNKEVSKTTKELNSSKSSEQSTDDIKPLPGYINTHGQYNNVMAEYTTKIINVNKFIDKSKPVSTKSVVKPPTNAEAIKKIDDVKHNLVKSKVESELSGDKMDADDGTEKSDNEHARKDYDNLALSNENLTDVNKSTIVPIKIPDDSPEKQTPSSSGSSHTDLSNMPILDPLGTISYTTATIDPRKLRTRHLKPPTLPKRGFHLGQRYKRL